MGSYDTLDYWSLRAHREGYPARSVYKLQEMDERFGLFRAAKKGSQRGRRGGTGLLIDPVSGHEGVSNQESGADTLFKVLDVGAAPGSWSLYALRRLGKRGSLVSVDLSPLSRVYDQGLFDGGNFFFLQGDITDRAIRSQLIARGPYHLVMSDVAPATTGNRSVDTLRSLALVEVVVSYAEVCLVQGGNLVVKVFQGGDTAEVLKRLRSLFASARSFKPEACRSESFETYLLGLGKREDAR